MMMLKILGGIDIAGAIAFMLLSFRIEVFPSFIIFCAALLFMKGLFIITGEILLSSLDILFSIILIISMFLTLPLVIVWIPTFLLLAKGTTSFI